MNDLPPQIKDIGKRLMAKVEARETREPCQLEMYPERKAAAPNELSRSSLFPAIHPKNRPLLKNVCVASQGNVSIFYTGAQLDQSYYNVFVAIAFIARGSTEDTEIRFSAYRILKLIGRSTGGANLKWLYEAFQCLTATSVSIMKDGKRIFWGSLLPEGRADLETGEYVVRINKDLAKLFGRGFTLVEWEQRRKLTHRPLAQWLHFYYASHKDPYPVSVTFLRGLSGSDTKHLFKFRQNLKTALDQIKDVGVIVSWEIGKDDLVKVRR